MTHSSYPSLRYPQNAATGGRHTRIGLADARRTALAVPPTHTADDRALWLPGPTPTPNYPGHLIEHWQAAEGTAVTIRPIRAADTGLELAFLSKLSPQSRYLRVFSGRGLLPGELKRLTDIDYEREMALIATIWTDRGERQIGVARYVTEEGGTANFAIVVDDRWQRRGLGEKLIQSLMAAARGAGVTALTAITLSTNVAMLQMARKLGAKLERVPGDGTVKHLTARL